MCRDCSGFIVLKAQRQKYKEKTIARLFFDHGIDCVHDKIPVGSCNRYRPDFIIDCATHFVIIEVDEHQHSTYECACEQGRMINIGQDVGGGLPVQFIRYNPDKYTDSNGKKRDDTMLARHKILIDTVVASKQHVPSTLLSAIYLYYDGFDSHKIETLTITIGV